MLRYVSSIYITVFFQYNLILYTFSCCNCPMRIIQVIRLADWSVWVACLCPSCYMVKWVQLVYISGDCIFFYFCLYVFCSYCYYFLKKPMMSRFLQDIFSIKQYSLNFSAYPSIDFL